MKLRQTVKLIDLMMILLSLWFSYMYDVYLHLVSQLRPKDSAPSTCHVC